MAHLPVRISLTTRPQLQPMPRAVAIMTALAALLYLSMLWRMAAEDAANDTFLFVFAGLWIDLMLLCAIADLAMRTPRWSPMLSIVLLPLAGAALFAALGMAARAPLAFAVPLALPPLILLAALSPWLSRWHARMPLPRMIGLCWCAVLTLSLATLLNAA